MSLDSVRAYWVLAAACACATAYVVYRLLASLGRDRLFADTPTTRIRSAAQGYVHLEGHAGIAQDHDAAAPLSGRPCVWWDYKIAIKETDSRGNTSWEPFDAATSVAPFTLSDADAQCLVGPVGAEVIPTSRDVWYGDTARPHFGPPEHGAVTTVERNYRYTECLLAVGTRLSVLGELRSHAEDGEVESGTRALLASWKADQAALLARFDRNHDGRLDSSEWDAAMAAAHAQAEAAVADARIERVSVVAQSRRGQPFLIAPLDARQIVRREQRFGLLYLLAAIVLVSVAVWAVQKARQPEHQQAAAAVHSDGG